MQIQNQFSGDGIYLKYHSRFGTRFHFDEHFQCKRFLLCITDVYLGAFRDKNSTYALTNTENSFLQAKAQSELTWIKKVEELSKGNTVLIEWKNL